MFELLDDSLKLANIGASMFIDDFEMQNIAFTKVNWTPPANGDPEIIDTLDFLDNYKDVIKEANDLALDKMLNTEGKLVGIDLAKNLINFFNKKTILHAGPSISWRDMAGPQLGALIGGIMYEGWADTYEKAFELLETDTITIEPNHKYNCVGPMAGITTPSMPVHILYDQVHDNYAYCNVNEGLGKVLRFGKVSKDVIDKLLWMRSDLMPVLNDALKMSGGIDVKSIIMQVLHMGDECHNRNKAATSLFYKEISNYVYQTDYPQPQKLEILDFIRNNDHYFLNLSMPFSKLSLLSIEDITYSSIVTIMARNGVEFGIKYPTNKKWFTAPANYVEGLYFPGFSEEDACLDLGDSAITETNGLGGFAMAASPAIVKFVGGSVNDALDYSIRMRTITHGTNPNFSIPALDFAGTASGIDLLKVLDTNTMPVINSGIAHKEAGIGQIGAGVVHPPMECFVEAIKEFAMQFENYEKEEIK